VLLLVQVVGAQGRLAGLADTVVGRLAGVVTALRRPVIPLSGVPRLAHVAVPEVAGAGSAAVQPHRVGLCMAPPQQLNGIWLVVTVDCAVVIEPCTGVIVGGNGLVAQRAAAWYRGLFGSLGHQVELDAGTQLALVGVVPAVAVRRLVATAAVGCCAVHAEEVAVCLVQQLAAALEAEGPALAVGVAAEQAAAAAGCVEVILSLHILVVRLWSPRRKTTRQQAR
jgi:hypothetical protein